MNNIIEQLKQNWKIVAIAVVALFATGVIGGKVRKRNKRRFQNWYMMNGPASESETYRQALRRMRNDPYRRAAWGSKYNMP